MGEVSEWFQAMRGVRQGCTLSPCLFNLFAEAVMRRALEGFEGGFKMGGRRITNLRYADDIILIATSAEELQELLDRVNSACKEFNLTINVEKTKVMQCQKDGVLKIEVDHRQLEVVEEFRYLGVLLTEDAKGDKEIKTRLGIARSVLAGLTKVWRSRSISVATKCRLLRALVWSVASYGCEAWTLTKTLTNRVEAFEMYCYRRLLRIPWTAKVTNREVLQRIREDNGFYEGVVARKLRYFGHVIRQATIQADIITGMTPGKRRPGRPRRQWRNDIEQWTGLSLPEAIQTARCREDWRRTVHVAVEVVKRRHDT